MPVNLEAEGCGISVAYGDEEGWRKAITYIQEHPEEVRKMGQRGRTLAEREFNDERCADEVAALLKEVIAR